MQRTKGRIVASRGRGNKWKQQFEPRGDSLSNTITTVTKDNYVIAKELKMAEEEQKTVEDYLYTDKDGEQWGIFKLTPRECGRLMNVSEKDIDSILATCSNSQAYKQFGNSIVVSCLCALFSQLNIKGFKPWNDMSEDERYELITKGCVPGGKEDCV